MGTAGGIWRLWILYSQTVIFETVAEQAEVSPADAFITRVHKQRLKGHLVHRF